MTREIRNPKSEIRIPKRIDRKPCRAVCGWLPFRISACGFRIWGLALLCLLLAGCGYGHRELFPRQYQTVAVEMFDNRTFYRGLEVDLGEALVKEIELRTPYKVTRTASAGTVIRGRIVEVEQRMLSRRRIGGLPQELEIAVTADFEWKDQRTGEVIRDRRGFTSVGQSIPASPVGQPVELAHHEAIQRLAEDIVSTMQVNW